MAKGRNTTTRTIRIPDAVWAVIERLSKENGMSVNEYLNRVLWHSLMRKR